jgi:septin family protein
MEDSISVAVAVIDTARCVVDSIWVIPNNVVTLEALKNSQEFYSTALDWILTVFGIFVTIVLAPGIWNWLESKKYKKELKNAKKRILDLENEFRKELNKFNEELEKQKKNMKNMNNELQGVKNHEY